jgi:hypothetical protein
MAGTRGGKNYNVTPLEQGRMYRLNQACIRAEKKAGQRRATRINNYKPPPEVEEARSAAKRSAVKNNYSPPAKKTEAKVVHAAVDTAHTVMPCTQVSSFAPSVTRQTQRLEISMLNLGGTNATPDMNRFFFQQQK